MRKRMPGWTMLGGLVLAGRTCCDISDRKGFSRKLMSVTSVTEPRLPLKLKLPWASSEGVVRTIGPCLKIRGSVGLVRPQIHVKEIKANADMAGRATHLRTCSYMMSGHEWGSIRKLLCWILHRYCQLFEVQSLGPYLKFMILDAGGLTPELQEEILTGTSATSLKGLQSKP